MKNVQRVNGMVEDAIAKGAKVLVCSGLCIEGELAKGAFYRLTLLEVNDSQADIFQLEIFDPVLTLEVFETECEAVEKANATEYGLN